MQPLAGETWLDTDASVETSSENVARGGSLSSAGREAAIGASLQITGRYFSSGDQPLISQSAVSSRKDEAPGELDVLLSSIRLRVALAASQRLRGIIGRILVRSSFRYALKSVESTGALSGQLDITRYVTQLGMHGGVPSYPILEVRRAEQTPENVLTTYTALWLLRELQNSFVASAAPTNGPEYRKYQSEVRELKIVLRLPGLASCVPPASNIRLRQSEWALVKDVQRRLRRREVPNSSPYQELVVWVEQILSGRPVAEPGELDWAFYGDRFDTKLFELWCLHALATEISRQLAVELPTVGSAWRTGGPVYTWSQLAGTLSLYFQRSPSAISTGRTARWHRRDDRSKPLGGIPDIVVHAVRREDGRERFAIVDPKLRQRSGPPVEELYKIIGYFDNFGISDQPCGAILYYSATAEHADSYEYSPSDGDGTLLAIQLNPAARNLRDQRPLAPLATAALGTLDIPPLIVDGSPSLEEAADPEEAAEQGVRARVREFAAFASTLPPSVLETSRRRVQVQLGEQRWVSVPGSVQTMLATADHVGFSLDPDADFSGPTIGVCASVESILHEYAITPAMAHDQELAEACGHKTLGQAVALLEHSVQSARSSRPELIALRDFLTLQGTDFSAIQQLITPMRRMNQQYRIPAAHRTLLTGTSWQGVWTALVGTDALLARVIDALVP